MRISALTIIQIVVSHFGIETDALLSCSRKKEYIKPLHIAMYLIMKYTDMTLRHTVNLFNRRNHCTVRHAIQSVSNQIDTNTFYRDEIQGLENSIELYIKGTIPADDIFMENDFFPEVLEVQDGTYVNDYHRPFSEHSVSGSVPVMNFKSLVR